MSTKIQWADEVWNPSGSWFMVRVGKKAAGNLLDGQIWEQVPEVLK